MVCPTGSEQNGSGIFHDVRSSESSLRTPEVMAWFSGDEENESSCDGRLRRLADHKRRWSALRVRSKMAQAFSTTSGVRSLVSELLKSWRGFRVTRKMSRAATAGFAGWQTTKDDGLPYGFGAKWLRHFPRRQEFGISTLQAEAC